jgi:hypothetical protein
MVYANPDGIIICILPPTLQTGKASCHPFINLFNGKLAGFSLVWSNTVPSANKEPL